MCVRKPAIPQCKRKQKEEENKSAMRGKCVRSRVEIKWMCLVLVIYAWGALRDTSTLHFVLLVHTQLIVCGACNLIPGSCGCKHTKTRQTPHSRVTSQGKAFCLLISNNLLENGQKLKLHLK